MFTQIGAILCNDGYGLDKKSVEILRTYIGGTCET